MKMTSHGLIHMKYLIHGTISQKPWTIEKWDKQPNILEDTSIINLSPNKHIKPDFYIGERQT